MRPQLPLRAAPLGLLLATALAAAALDRHQEQGQAYSVRELRAGLQRAPGRWVGRTVQVRGMALSSGCVAWDAGRVESCRDRSAYLLDRDGVSLLQVAAWGPDPLLAALRRLPLAGRLVPGPQAVRWGVVATYRVRLQAAPILVCDATPCYAGLLLEAAP
jgi:hypothetical protein